MSDESKRVPLPPQGEPAHKTAPPSAAPDMKTQHDNAPPPPSGAPVLEVQHNEMPPPSGAPVRMNEPHTMSGVTAQEAVSDTASAAGTGGLPAPEGQPVIYQDRSLSNGITKCPSCGSSDMQLNMNTGLLHCNFCHREFSEVSDGIDGEISRLNGTHLGIGVSDIAFDAADVVTLKCSACGAEVVVDTNEAPQARCHWCRNMLSLNQQVPNGAVPDAVMPFRVTKEQARLLIEQFVGNRRFFAHPRFKAEFTTENIMGVYLPYMVVDVNAYASFRGEGEHQTRKYTTGSGNNRQTRYDADAYAVGRDFDLYIDDLTVEASADKLNQTTGVNSNNIINAILPYPLKETVRFNANYLRGFTSEKRSVNREQVENLVMTQVRDIARWRAWQQAMFYDRGIHWDVENIRIDGELWKTVYLPVWLYSYLEVKSNGKKFLHYVAVNACTGETMGSIPIHMPKLLAISAIVEAIGIVTGVFLAVMLFLAS